jgi:hypothetical protein
MVIDIAVQQAMSFEHRVAASMEAEELQCPILCTFVLRLLRLLT